MSMKSKGINGERELIHLFWANGWSACRVAGSGSTKYPSPDIIAGNNIRKLVIESKVTKDRRQALSSKQINELREFAAIFGAEPWVAVKFNNHDWYFLTLEDINEAGNNYAINFETAVRRGLSFDELLGI
jgi:Holliday junction resolvase